MLPTIDAALIAADGQRLAAAESGGIPGRITSFCHVGAGLPCAFAAPPEVWMAGQPEDLSGLCRSRVALPQCGGLAH